MKVSVIVATYNRKVALEACVARVRAQTYSDWELVVVDDGSRDGTDTLFLTDTDPRVRYIRLEQNQGATVARNRGLDEARGDYTLVWDSDDLLDPDALATLVSVFERAPDAVVVSAPTRVLVQGAQIAIPVIPEGDLSLDTIMCARMPKYKLLRLVRVSSGGTVRYRGRNLDFMVNTELVAIGRWVHTQRPLGDHFILSDTVSLTRTRRVPNAARSIARAPHLVDYLDRFGDRLMHSCPGRYAAHVYGATIGLVLAGRETEARTLLRKAVGVYPADRRCRMLLILTWVPGAATLLRIAIWFEQKVR